MIEGSRDHIQALDHLMLGYFHLDWPLNDPTPDDVIRRFAAAEPATAQRANAEIKTLLSSSTEADLAALRLLDSQSQDPRGGRSWSDWLAHVREVLAAG